MKIDMTRLLVEGIVDRALKNIRHNPDRSVRNLIDMALSHAKGRFQKRFFNIAQQMMASESSPYFEAAQHAVRDIDLNTLRTFGMNLGYDALTVGAKTIRSLEAAIHVNIPWIINIEYARRADGLTPVTINALVAAGKALGIHAYALSGLAEDLRDLGPVLEAHTDCAFVVFIRPGQTSAEALGWLAAQRHAMLCLSMDDPALAEANAALLAARCIRCLYTHYGAETVRGILDGTAARRAVAQGIILLYLVAEKDCPAEARRAAHAYAIATRDTQEYPLFILDYFGDQREIDRIISDQPCFLAVGADGQVYTSPAGKAAGENVLQSSLRDIILRVMPPTGGGPTANPAFDA